MKRNNDVKWKRLIKELVSLKKGTKRYSAMVRKVLDRLASLDDRTDPLTLRGMLDELENDVAFRGRVFDVFQLNLSERDFHRYLRKLYNPSPEELVELQMIDSPVDPEANGAVGTLACTDHTRLVLPSIIRDILT